MPSTKKTQYLQLNHWIGSDRPHMDDFIADNIQVDQYFSNLTGRVSLLEKSGGENELITELQEHVKNADIHTTATQKNNTASHISNGSIHVTAQEKATWNGMTNRVKISRWVGTGENQIYVDFGFKPAFGCFFALDRGLIDPDFSLERTLCHAGFFSSEGCSKNVTISDNGIRVVHNPVVPLIGSQYNYNEAGLIYIYIAWRE